MKKKIALLLALLMCLSLIVACAPDGPGPAADNQDEVADNQDEVVDDQDEVAETPDVAPGRLGELGLDSNRRFVEPVEITVATWDRRNDGGSDPTDNAFTEWITEQMLEQHNVVITEFVPIYRWEEVNELTVLLAEQEAPTISYTFNFATVDEFGRQDSIFDLAPLLEDSEEIFPYLWDWLTFPLLYWNQDAETGHVWAIPARGANLLRRYVTHIREDWLAELGLPMPSTLEEFEAALFAFRDNAELLLGDDAAHMVPLFMTDDVGWLLGPLVESFIPNDITDRDLYITEVGGDARRFFAPGAKEAIRVVNRWFNEGLIHPDFAISETEEMENLIRAGFTGAVAGHSHNQAIRGGEDGWIGQLHQTQGEHANLVVVNTFQNDAGYYRSIVNAGPPDRTMFVPKNPLGNETTLEQAVAALLYIDFLSRPETIQFLQIGFEGINHIVHENGAIEMIPAEPGSRYVMNSPQNFDITMPINGFRMATRELTELSRPFAYTGVDPRIVIDAYALAAVGVRTRPNVNAGVVGAEEGMGDTIRERGNAAWARAIMASVDDFDAVYEAEIGAILSDFAAAAMAEREQLWEARWGDLTMVPTE